MIQFKPIGVLCIKGRKIMTRILEDDYFEECRLFDENSLVNQLAAAKIETIFRKLFQNTKVDPDEFYFTIFDDEDSNAFFINKEQTIEKKKNIIAISRGLIKACHNEAELAGIIGHESGHYLWKELLGGQNSIFQEHAADLYAIDLLRNGGYNPRHHLAVCERLFSDYGRVKYNHISLGVHGNGLLRSDDIKDYMTKIANEEGDFPPLDNVEDTDYKSFQEAIAQAFSKEGYYTYIEKCFQKELGTKDLSEIPVQDALRIMLQEMQNNNITIDKTVRFQQIFKIIETYAQKNVFLNKTPELTKLCQEFFLETTNQIKNISAQNNLQTKLNINEYMKQLISNNYQMLYNFKLKKFGDFVTQSENIEHFVNFQNKEDAVHWAEEMYKLSWTLEYCHAFTDDEYPHWTAKKEQNIGHPLPWNEILNFIVAEKNNVALSWAYDSLIYDIHNYNRKYSTQYDDKDYIGNLYFSDKNKIVLAYGEEAKKMHKDAELANAIINYKEKCILERQQFQRNMNFYNALALFAMTNNKEEKIQHISTILKTIQDISINYIVDYTESHPAYICNPEIDEIKQIWNDSPARQYFDNIYDADVINLAKMTYENKNKEKNIKVLSELPEEDKPKYLSNVEDNNAIETIARSFRLSTNIYQKQKVVIALLQVANYLENMDANNEYTAEIYKIIGEIISVNCHIKNYLLQVPEKEVKLYATRYDLLNNDLIKYYNYSIAKSAKAIRTTCNSWHDYETIVPSIVSVSLKELVNPRLKSSPLLDQIMETMGFDATLSYSENLSRLDNYIGKEIILRHSFDFGSSENKQLNNSIYDEKYIEYSIIKNQPCYDFIRFHKKFGVLILANNIKRNNSWDLKEAMKYLRLSDHADYHHPFVPDMLAESIQQGDKFNQLSLADKIYVYDVMEHLDLFSEKYANKEEFLHTIVREITNYPNHDKAMEYAEKLLSGQYVHLDIAQNERRNIEFAQEVQLLIKFYAKGKSDELGIDDGSDEFFAKAEKCADTICADIPMLDYFGQSKNNIKKFSPYITNQILNEISNNIVSQEMTAKMLANKGLVQFSGDDAEKYDIYARGALALVSALAKTPQHAKILIDFLNSKFTDKSVEKVFASLPARYDLQRGCKIYIQEFNIQKNFVYDKASLQMLHKNFWSANLPARAYIMKRILNAYTADESTEEGVKAKKLNLVVDMYFDKKSPYYNDAQKIINAFYNNLQDYELDLIFGALVSANQKDDNNKKIGGELIGEGLKMFFENKGPAFVKFGQMLSYLPQLDADIRRPLAKLRDKADIPTRDALFKLLNETLPDEELKKISRVDKILGAGSYFIIAQITYENKDHVVALMRPHAKELSASGMNTINNTIAYLSEQDNKYKVLQNVAYQAKISSESETDIESDFQKYLEAVKIYNDIKITTPNGEYTPRVAKWKSYGSGKDGNVYKIMDMAEGEAMTSNKFSEQEKHDAAVAYVTLELCNLLSGARWDTDRHQGQQNFKAVQEHENGFKNFIIGIFDTGAQIQHTPNKKDKIMLGEMLYGMARAARTGRSFSDYMIKKVMKIDKIGKKLKIDTLYIDEVQRGLITLSDIITYQKELKDENGNIIQEEKSLTSKEMGEIVNSILSSGLVDKTMIKTIKAKVILNKLRPLRKGWINSLSEGLKKIAPTIKIEKKNPSEDDNNLISRKNKPVDEIEKLANPDQNSLGVNIKYIKPSVKPSSQYTSVAVAALKDTQKI